VPMAITDAPGAAETANPFTLAITTTPGDASVEVEKLYVDPVPDVY
jgi:hypothetical protein